MVLHAETGARPRGETRDRILAVAAELFRSHGYAGTSIRDIAERLDLTKSSLYHHFRSKEEILRAVTDAVREEFDQFAEELENEPVDPTEVLGRFVDLLARRSAVFTTYFGDPSASGDASGGRPGVLVRVVRPVAKALTPDGDQEARVRAAAAVGAAVVGTLMTMSCRRGRELRDTERSEIVAAAVRALSG